MGQFLCETLVGIDFGTPLFFPAIRHHRSLTP